MKKLLLIISLVSICFAEKDTKFEFIQEISGFTKGELYTKSIIWLAKNFVSVNDVIQYKDSNSGIIICRGMGEVNEMLTTKKFTFLFTIYTKDDKIKVVFETIKAADKNIDVEFKPTAEKIKMQINFYAFSLATFLKTKESTDW